MTVMSDLNNPIPTLVKRPVDIHPLQLDSSLEESEKSGDRHQNVDDIITATSNLNTKNQDDPKNAPLKSVVVAKKHDPLTAVLEANYERDDHFEEPTSFTTTTSRLQRHGSKTSLSGLISSPKQRANYNRNCGILWSQNRNSILSKYTTSEDLTLHSSYLGGNCLDNSHHPSLSNQVKQRLEQLDNFEDNQVKEITNLSQSDYVGKIEQLNLALTQSWNTDQRVKALKIAIQCAKLLSDVSVLRFYPSKFVLVTDILDNFGKLVDNRIIDKANQPSGQESARETCRNWFLKVASIRELTPRFYVELSILKTCGFILVTPPNSDSKSHLMTYYFQSLLRMSKMVRGIGNPVVASYARCYICRVAYSILDPLEHSFKEIYLHNLLASSDLLDRVSRYSVNALLFTQKLSLWDCYNVLLPSYQWILQCLLVNSDYDLLRNVRDKLDFHVFGVTSSSSQDLPKLFVLYAMIESSPPDFIVENLDDWFSRIKNLCRIHLQKSSNANQLNSKNAHPSMEIPSNPVPLSPIPSQVPIYIVVNNLGKALICSKTYVSVTNPTKRLTTLNDVWEIVGKFDVNEYMTCAKTWLNYTCKYLSRNEINFILGDIIRRIQPNRVFVNYYEDLVDMINDMVVNKQSVDEFYELFAMDNFTHLFDMIQKELFIVRACKITLESFLAVVNSNKNQQDCNHSLDILELANRSSDKSVVEDDTFDLEYDDTTYMGFEISDFLIINQLTRLCKILHDSIGPFTFDDERRQMSHQIITFLRLVTFDIDLNSELDYLAECRASFDKLESVIYYLVHRSHALAIKCRKIINKKRKKTPSFINSCLAYSFITIPTLTSIKSKAHLLLEGTQVALMNSSVSHADAFLKELLNLLFEYHHATTSSNNLMGYEHIGDLLNFSNNLLGLFLAYEDDIDLRCKSSLITLVSQLDSTNDITLNRIDDFLGIPKEET